MELLNGLELRKFVYNSQKYIGILCIIDNIPSKNSRIVFMQLSLPTASKALFYSIRSNLISISAMISSVFFELDYACSYFSGITFKLFEGHQSSTEVTVRT